MRTQFSKILIQSTLAFSLIASVGQAQDLQLDATQGSYEVPVKDPHLADAASFKLRHIQLKQDDNHFQLGYLVPVELTGDKNFMHFDGTLDGGEGTLNYEGSKMNCLVDQSTLMCKVNYKDLKFDQDKVEKILNTRFQGEDLQKRISIQKDFSTDPVGIVKIKLK